MNPHRWKIELWVDAAGHALQANAVGLDRRGATVAIRVFTLPPENPLDERVVPLLVELLGLTTQPPLFTDGGLRPEQSVLAAFDDYTQ